MARTDLDAVFGGAEPIENPANEAMFRALVGLGGDRPFECVGDRDECGAAALLAASRGDRASSVVLRRLAGELAGTRVGAEAVAAGLLEPRGTHHIPDRYAPADLLARAR